MADRKQTFTPEFRAEAVRLALQLRFVAFLFAACRAGLTASMRFGV